LFAHPSNQRLIIIAHYFAFCNSFFKFFYIFLIFFSKPLGHLREQDVFSSFALFFVCGCVWF